MQAHVAPLRIGIAGLGAVGKKLAEALDAGIDGLVLGAIAVRDTDKARATLANLKQMPVLTDIATLSDLCDVVVECAPAALLPAIAKPVLQQGKTVVVLSSGALLTNMDLIDLAKQHGGTIVVPTGALLGLDAVCAAAEGTIHAVRMVTRKPVKGLVGAKYLVDNNIQIEGISEPLRIFKGTPREAAEGFAANLNVAVALSLAGIGPDRTTLEVWADPHIDKNTHRIEVESDAALFSMEIQNIPTDNPKTGRITALSVIAALRKMRAPLRVGT
jgi:aspartate dehydrogenase